nr:PREDICTED: coiled-coil domain-containing protein 169 isoform X3 [Lepisosteus oculatus]
MCLKMEEFEFVNYDAPRLRFELDQEKQMKEMLEDSVSELSTTVMNLEKRLACVEDEGNEWKTRHDTQQELNRQLERQIALLQEKLEEIRANPVDRFSSIRTYDEMPLGALKQLLKQLENDKKSLQSQLKDYMLRTEQEAKASAVLDSSRKQQMVQAHGTMENQLVKGSYNLLSTNKDSERGPIRKTATISRLPKIKR